MLAFLALSCVNDTWEPPVWPSVEEGAPVVGAAEGYLKLPVGTPLSGYSVRCGCLTGQGRQDLRDSAYTVGFVPSTGVQTHPAIKVIWVENGDDHLVITKTDSIYSFDGLVEDLEERLTEATGIDLHGKVIHTANHSHSSYGDFSDAITFYLGSDTFNEEIFQRFSGQVADVALDAFEGRQPAKIGMSVTSEWDPNDQIYSDRRGANNELVVGEPPMLTGKDPNLVLMRFDTVDDEPLAVLVNFGMHGIVLSEQNPLVSTDSGGGIEAYLQEEFDDEVIVMFTQGSGGDQSPRGEQSGFARVESLGERAAPALMDAWDRTETSDQPIRMQTASRSIPQHPRQIRVTRDGTVDWHYLPYDRSRRADDEVFDASGALISPLDEYNTDYGALFCGTGDLALPVGTMPGTDVPPYSNCLEVEALAGLIGTVFEVDPTDYGLPAESEQPLPLPIPDTLKAGTTASHIEGVQVTLPDGSSSETDVLFGFFPGEATHMYTQQFQRRAADELGIETSVLVAYAQDHEGYLLIPEDWLAGEYEADIVVWGPLQGEHIMEGVLGYTGELLMDDVHQHPDPLNEYARTTYPERELPTLRPDVTPDAGTVVSEAPETFWVPDGFEPEFEIPAVVPRVQGMVQFAWKGGDPGIDEPVVTLERERDGSWEPVTSHSGRPITDSLHDILKATTPDPLTPLDAEQEHYWWAGWQAVGHVRDRAGLPLGMYRLRVEGTHFAGSAETWPWDGTSYTVTSDPFEVVPADLDVSVSDGEVSVSFSAPAAGYRYIAAGGDQRGANPVGGELTVTFETPEGDVTEQHTGETVDRRTRFDVVVPDGTTAVRVVDRYGNAGAFTFE